jgi:cyclophilin family peptidyl-prolyl cis-trans isomerase
MNMTLVYLAVLCAAVLVAAGCAADKQPNSAPSGAPPQPAVKPPPTGAQTQPAAATTPATKGNPVVVIETSKGTIKAELWADKAPVTVANFLRYADERHYDGLVFHRIMDGFMIQGGGATADGRPRATHDPIRNEARPELRNRRGTLAMARTGVVDSATSQFFINLVDNTGLDQRSRDPDGFGYCAFGKVIEGMDVVDKIAKVPTKVGPGGREKSVPTETVEIVRVRRADAKQ